MQLSLELEFFEPLLTQGFVAEQGDGVAQVHASGPLDHGDADAPVRVFFPQPGGQPRALPAEKEPAFLFKGHLGVAHGPLGGAEPQGLGAVAPEKILQILVNPQVQQVLVVQSGPLDGLFGDVEAQGTHQVQPGPGDGAGPCDISRILWDLRFHQHYIYHSVSPLASGASSAPL